MAIIEDVLALVDTTVTGIAGGTYGDVVTALNPVVAAASVLLVILVGINIVIQTVPMTYGTLIGLGVRIVGINLFLTYANFDQVYNALTNAPAEIGASFLSSLSDGEITDISGGTSAALYSELDQLYLNALDVGTAISENGGIFVGALTSVMMFLIAALMAVVTIIVMSAAKIMLAVLIALAPVAIVCTFFKQSSPVFEAWVKLAIGFAFVPLLVAAMAGFTIATASAVAPADLDTVETLGDALSFVVVMLLGMGLMILVPTFAQALAATNIGLGAIAANAASYPGRAMRAGGTAARGADNFVRGAAAGASGKGVSDRSSGAAKVGSYAGSGAAGLKSRAAGIASKMKKG